MNILITGGAGFIGSHTADALLAHGHRVRVLDLLDPQIHGGQNKFPAYLDPRIECIQGDVRSVKDLGRALEDIDAVYHFAALTGVGQSMYDIRNYVDINCNGTATLIETIVKTKKQLKRLILSSSRAVYGEGTHFCSEHGLQYPQPRSREKMEAGSFDVFCPHCQKPLQSRPTAEDRPYYPMSVYAWSKKHQEDYCLYAAKTYGLSLTILRYFNVYGQRQSLQNPYTGVVSIFFSRFAAGQPVYLYEHGKPGRDFVHVSDVAQANVLALENDTPPGSCFNVGMGEEQTIQQIAEALAAASGVKPQFEDRGEFRVGDIRSCYADLSRSRSILGYEPRINLIEGMKQFASWARGEKSVDLYQKTVDELTRYGLFGQAKPGTDKK